jgi:hypothetical protein
MTLRGSYVIFKRSTCSMPTKPKTNHFGRGERI